jgi:hypothetical protein
MWRGSRYYAEPFEMTPSRVPEVEVSERHYSRQFQKDYAYR